jgi:hypothetical protein
MGERSVAYNISVGRPEGRRLPGIPRHSWEDIIKVYLKRSRMRGYGPDGSGLG